MNHPAAPRSRTLDILRAAAIVLVLGRHMTVCPVETSWTAHNITTVWARGGWVGVDLFFVLSGFLVSGLLFRAHQKTGTLNIKTFLIRRGFKIYPSFWLLIATTVAAEWLWHAYFNPPGLLRELFFLQNYGGGLWPHTWSLAVEEHFYLLLPLLLLVLARRNSGTSDPFAALPKIYLAVAAACLAMRITVSARAPFDAMTHLYPTHLRVDSLLLGATLAYFVQYHPAKVAAFADKRRVPVFLLGIAAFVPAFVFPLESSPFMPTFGVLLLAWGGAAILLATHGIEPKPILPANILAFIGSRSYSIYLWHIAVKDWGAKIGAMYFPNANWFAATSAYFAVSLVLGIAMASLVEYPLLHLRDRFFPPKNEVNAPTPPPP